MYVFSNYTNGWENAVSSIFAAPLAFDEILLPISNLPVVNAPNQKFNRSILSFGQDSSGEIYLLTTQIPLSQNPFLRDDGEVFRLVKLGEDSSL